MASQSYAERYFGKDITEVDPAVSHLIDLEEERQARKLIMIPSESMAPLAVRQALSSVFNNIYAEGYPPTWMTRIDEDFLMEFDHQLPHYRRYYDRRFYKGDDYVNFVESLAQRRAAECFANGRVSAEQIYVNVQPLSGAAANLAVYEAFLEPGDALMGMNLFQGGHLTHGSEFNISGKRYRAISYGVSKATERLDYDAIMMLALEHKPKIIVAGYTSYPWAPDWEKFREIADSVGALLMADIAHPAGMVIAGYYPSPVGIADVITFTTHKTICGPRGACIMTTDEEKAQRIDQAVFPGEQGGPHVNKFAAMAVAFKIAQTEEFRDLQRRIVENSKHLAHALQDEGMRLAYGGTDTHLLVIDLKGVKTPNGCHLYGEIAVRILDLCGIVANKNTIPGDEVTALGTGVRLGTPWVTQRGMGKPEMEKIASIIARALKNIHPYPCYGLTGPLPRGKIEQDVLEELKMEVASLAAGAKAETLPQVQKPAGGWKGRTYPHYQLSAWHFRSARHLGEGRGILFIRGKRALYFLQQISTSNVASLRPGESQRSLLLYKDGHLIDEVFVKRLEADQRGRDRYIMLTTPHGHERVKTWLRNLSDGYVIFDDYDFYAKMEGPITVLDLSRDEAADEEVRKDALEFRRSVEKIPPIYREGEEIHGLALYKNGHAGLFHLAKPYFIGQRALGSIRPHPAEVKKKEFRWEEKEGALKRTCLYEEHLKLTKKLLPFAGWEMPAWYTSVSEEHRAVRQTAGLFDVSHMGAFEIAGEHATSFLELVCSNYVGWLEEGESHYSYLLDPDGQVIDDIFLYRRARDLYLMVVNAANAEKDWAWLNAVNEGEVIIDKERPETAVEGKAILRDLKDPSTGERQKVDLALQGPNSLAILQSLAADEKLKERLARIRRTEFIETELAGIPLIIARTGYCGEEWGYEIFVHPSDAPRLWNLLLERGQPFGIKPAGLGARDSTRTEAGLPLYGHELAGPFEIDPMAAGFGSYVKLHKPFFIGRRAFIEKALFGTKQIVRFRMNEKGVRMPSLGDPVVNHKGKYIGAVTSCTLDSSGYLTGMAYVERRYSKKGAQIGIFSLHDNPNPEKPKAELAEGDQVLLHNWATVLTRFWNKEAEFVAQT
ncbi:MAG: glycine cleavage system aminomethyltransferase GcvT [Anaerolineae bacterium]